MGQFYHEYQNLPPELQTPFSGSNGLKKLADSLIDRMLVLDDAYNKLVDQENAPLLEEARASILRQMIHESEVDSRVNVTEQEVQDYYEGQKDYFSTPPEARIQSIRIYLGATETNRRGLGQERKKPTLNLSQALPGNQPTSIKWRKSMMSQTKVLRAVISESGYVWEMILSWI